MLCMVFLSPKIPFLICFAIGSFGSTNLSLLSTVLIIGLFAICNKVDTVVKGPVINVRPIGTTILTAIL
jgi:hypothetical protein